MLKHSMLGASSASSKGSYGDGDDGIDGHGRDARVRGRGEASGSGLRGTAPGTPDRRGAAFATASSDSGDVAVVAVPTSTTTSEDGFMRGGCDGLSDGVVAEGIESLFDELLPDGDFGDYADALGEPLLDGFGLFDDGDCGVGGGVVVDDAHDATRAVVSKSDRIEMTCENATTPAQDSEAERKARLIRNRESAQNSRARKREYVRDLEKRARMLEAQNGELQAMVMHLTNENHALRMGMGHASAAMPAVPYMMPMYAPAMIPMVPTPKLPLPPKSASIPQSTPPAEVQSAPSTHAPKRRKQTVVSAATALALGTLSVVALVAPQSTSRSRSSVMQQSSSSSRRRLLALSGPEMPDEDHLAMLGVNITSLREEVTELAARTFALPDKATASGVALWDDFTSDGRSVDVFPGTDVNDPWYSAFKAAGMTHVDLLSRVMCNEMFKFKPADTADVVEAKITEVWKPHADEYELKKPVSRAIPMLSGKENASDFPGSSEVDSNSVVSVLLPPPTKTTNGMMQQLNKVFVVTFNKRTTDYTTYSCLMPQTRHV